VNAGALILTSDSITKQGKHDKIQKLDPLSISTSFNFVGILLKLFINAKYCQHSKHPTRTSEIFQIGD
jgi:hypothetical protein